MTYLDIQAHQSDEAHGHSVFFRKVKVADHGIRENQK
jgi:hypothetical protein